MHPNWDSIGIWTGEKYTQLQHTRTNPGKRKSLDIVKDTAVYLATKTYLLASFRLQSRSEMRVIWVQETIK